MICPRYMTQTYLNLVWDSQIRNSQRKTVSLCPALFGQVAVEIIRISDPFFGIALRIFAAGKNVISDFRSPVCADITIGTRASEGLVINVGRGRQMDHFMPQGTCLDFHAVDNTGHLVDYEGVRAGGIDDNRSLDDVIVV